MERAGRVAFPYRPRRAVWATGGFWSPEWVGCGCLDLPPVRHPGCLSCQTFIPTSSAHGEAQEGGSDWHSLCKTWLWISILVVEAVPWGTPWIDPSWPQTLTCVWVTLSACRYGRPDPLLRRGHDVRVSLQMASVQYVHTQRFQAEVVAFVQHFTQLQDVLGRQRAAIEGQTVGALASPSGRSRSAGRWGLCASGG